MLILIALLLASSSSFQTFGRASKHSPLDSFILSWLISASFPQLSSLNDFSHSVFIAKHSHTQTQHNAAPSCSLPFVRIVALGAFGSWRITRQCIKEDVIICSVLATGVHAHATIIIRWSNGLPFISQITKPFFLSLCMIFDMYVLTFKFGMFHLYISNRPCTNERCFWILMTLGRFEFWHALRSSPNETSVKACRVVWRLSWDKLARFRGLIICAYQHASWCKQRSEQTSNVPFRATWPVCGGRLHLPLFIVVCQFRTSSRKICETFHKTWTFRTSDRTAYSRLYPSSCTQYQHWRWCSTLFRYCWSEVSDCDK